MRRVATRLRPLLAVIALLTAECLVADRAAAAPAIRTQVVHRGGFELIGNTLGQDCASSVTPLVGEIVQPCGQGTNDGAPDVFWRSDVPAAGSARADHAFEPSDARTAAVLAVPSGATVARAYLYWAATRSDPGGTATLTLPSGATEAVLAEQTFSAGLGPTSAYAAVADVTALVQAHGNGAYRVGDVALPEWRDISQAVAFGGWWMVVVYDDPSATVRTTTLFDGLDAVLSNTPQTATWDGITMPDGRGTGLLGVVGLGGDQSSGGDSLTVDGAFLGDAANPVGNVFNGTRTWLGVPTHRPGDLPEMPGGVGSFPGMDIDVFDLGPVLDPASTSPSVTAWTTGGGYWLATFVGSIATTAPSFVDTLKTVSDLDGPPTRPGDELEFSIDVINTGDGAAVGVTSSDVLVAELTFVSGSVTIDGEPASDAAGDDRADFDPASATLTVRLGDGADANVGGTMLPGTSSTIAFRATVADGAAGTITNQATVVAQGAPEASWLSGSIEGPGQPTAIVVDAGEGGSGAGGSGEGGDPSGAVGSSTASTAEVTVATAATSTSGAGGAPPAGDAILHGSGVTCSIGGGPASRRTLAAMLGGALAALALRRAQRHRSHLVDDADSVG